MVVYISPNYKSRAGFTIGDRMSWIDGYILRVWFVGGDYHAEWCGDVHEGMVPWIETDFFTWIREF